MTLKLLEMALKGSIAVIYLFLVIKALGKKQISELNIFDYIIGLSLGNIAAEMTVNKEITILEIYTTYLSIQKLIRSTPV